MPMRKSDFLSEQSTRSTLAGDSSDERDSLSGNSSGDPWEHAQETFSPKMPPPPQYYQKLIDTAVSANLPCDFASAWNAAANVSGWKREEPDLHPKARKWLTNKKVNKKTSTPKVITQDAPVSCNFQPHSKAVEHHESKAQDQDDRVEDMPLPKFLVAATMTGPAARATTSPCPHTPMQIPMKAAGKLPEDQALYSNFVFAKGYVKPGKQMRDEQVQLPLPGLCQEYLKIDLPSARDFTSSSLNLSIPCKKRVPDWGF